MADAGPPAAASPGAAVRGLSGGAIASPRAAGLAAPIAGTPTFFGPRPVPVSHCGAAIGPMTQSTEGPAAARKNSRAGHTCGACGYVSNRPKAQERDC